MTRIWPTWRRRIGSSATPLPFDRTRNLRQHAHAGDLLAGAGRPVDLGVGLAEVHGPDVLRADPLLAQRPGVGELHERPGRRVRLVGDLAVEAVEQLGPVPLRPVADAERLLAARQHVGDELVHRPDPRRDDLLQAARHLPVHGVEHLALAGVDDRHDDAVGAPVRERQQVERRDPDHRDAQRQRQRLGRRQADPHAGEQPGADVDGDQSELVEAEVGLLADEVDRRGEDLGVAATAPDLEQRDHALVAADGDADLLGRRLDPQDQHDMPRASGTVTPGAAGTVTPRASGTGWVSCAATDVGRRSARTTSDGSS